MTSLRRGLFYSSLAGYTVFVLIAAGCGGRGQTSDTAVPSFCPDRYSSGLVQSLAADSSPRAYYQDLVTTVGTPLDIVLYTCDPDHPETSEGLSWEVAVPPFWDGPPPPPYHGSLSSYSGSYPAGGVITYTPDPGYLGTDSFPIHVWDGTAWSNTAEILITVDSQPLTGQRLYFGGQDDLSRTHLWYYDGSSPIATISGSAQALSANGISRFQEGVPFQSRVHIIVIDTSGEGTFVADFDPEAEQFRFFPQVSGASDMEVFNNNLYVSGSEGLWSSDGSGSWSTVSGTGSLFPYGLNTFGSKIYFAGGSSPGVQLWSYDGSTLSQETSIGSDLWPRNITECNGTLYFNGTFGTVSAFQYLWATDGTGPAATVTNSVTTPENMICFDNKLYFTAMGAPGSTAVSQLWTLDVSDVLDTLTNVTSSLGFMATGLDSYPAVAGSTLYMRGNDDAFANWIWAHDGSSPIATLPGSDGLFPFFTTVFDGKLYFSSSWLPGPASGYDNLGSYDPGTGSITAISNVTMGLNPRGFVVYSP